jgi:hypothetical protein
MGKLTTTEHKKLNDLKDNVLKAKKNAEDASGKKAAAIKAQGNSLDGVLTSLTSMLTSYNQKGFDETNIKADFEKKIKDQDEAYIGLAEATKQQDFALIELIIALCEHLGELAVAKTKETVAGAEDGIKTGNNNAISAAVVEIKKSIEAVGANVDNARAEAKAIVVPNGWGKAEPVK